MKTTGIMTSGGVRDIDMPSRIRERQRRDHPDRRQRSRTCPDCDVASLIKNADGERICEECGAVLDDSPIDHGPEWRAFDEAERSSRSRIGAPATVRLHDKGFSTAISWKDKDGYGRTLPAEKRRRMARLRTWHQRIRVKDASEQNLQVALSELARMVAALGIPTHVHDVAAVKYRHALSEDLIQGRSIEGVGAACLYVACREEGIPRSLDEIANVARVARREIGRTYRMLAEELEIDLEPMDPKAFVPRFCSRLELSKEIERQANEIIDASVADGLLSGKSPTSFAAAAIYGSARLCEENLTQDEVAEEADVTPVTIRNRYREQLTAFENANAESS